MDEYAILRKIGADPSQPCKFCGQDVPIRTVNCPHCGRTFDGKRAVALRKMEEALEELRLAVGIVDHERALAAIRCLEAVDHPAQTSRFGQTYGDLRKRLQRQLDERFAHARESTDLDAMTQALDDLCTVFGPQNYHEARYELDSIKRELRDRCYKAKAAIQTNCLSQAFEVLRSGPQWKGGPLGQRREKLATQCSEASRMRAEAIDKTRNGILTKDVLHALEWAGRMMQFQLSAKVVAVRPSARDIEVNRQIAEVLGMLKDSCREAAAQFIENDNWAKFMAMLNLAEKTKGPDLSWLTAVLRHFAGRRLDDFYAEAIRLEKQKRFMAAEKAWRRVMAVPNEFFVAGERRYAEEFSRRRDACLLNERGHMVRRALSALFLLWCYLVCGTVLDLARRVLFNGVPHPEIFKVMMPIAAQFLLFCLFAAVMRHPRLLLRPALIRRVQHPPFWLLLSLLLVISPLSAVMYELYLKLVQFLSVDAFWAQSWIAVLAIGGFWCLVDAFRAQGMRRRFPDSFSLTMSWAFAVLMVFAFRGFHLCEPQVFAGLSVIQAVVFTLFQIMHYCLYAHAAEAHETVNGVPVRA